MEEDYREASEKQQIINSAKRKYHDAERLLETQRKITADCFDELGKLRIKAWAETMSGFYQIFSRFSMESLGCLGNEKPQQNETWDPKKFAEVVQRSTKIVREIQANGRISLGKGETIAVGAFGGQLLFCNPSSSFIVSALEEVAQKNGTVAWLSGDATPDNYVGVVSKFLVAEMDVLPFLKLVKDRVDTLAYSQRMNVTQTRKLAGEVEKVSSQINLIRQGVENVRKIVETNKDLTELLQSCLVSLLTDLSAVITEYSQRTQSALINVDTLSEIEKKTIELAWLVGQTLVEVIVIPIIVETGTVPLDTKGKINELAIQCDQLKQSTDQLQSEKQEILRLLNEAKNLVPTLQNEYQRNKEELKNQLLHFAKFKIKVWNEQANSYLSTLVKFDEIQLDQDLMGLSPIYPYNEAISELKNVSQRAIELAENDEKTNSDERLIDFAVDSISAEEDENSKFYQWICEINTIDNKVDGVGEEEFVNASRLIERITGKENLKRAQWINGAVSQSCQGIQAVNLKMKELQGCLSAYETTIGNVMKQLLPIANRVEEIGTPYESGTLFSSLVSQEKKTFSISWEYAQMLFKLLTDSFYVREKACLVLNEEQPKEIETRLKTIRKTVQKLKGESAYAADSLWEKPAKTAKWVAFGVVALLVIAGILTTILRSAWGLLYIADAAVAFPIFYLVKNMPLNKLTFLRWVRVAVSGALAILILILII